jgi:hypothetical protein
MAKVEVPISKNKMLHFRRIWPEIRGQMKMVTVKEMRDFIAETYKLNLDISLFKLYLHRMRKEDEEAGVTITSASNDANISDEQKDLGTSTTVISTTDQNVVAQEEGELRPEIEQDKAGSIPEEDTKEYKENLLRRSIRKEKLQPLELARLQDYLKEMKFENFEKFNLTLPNRKNKP